MAILLPQLPTINEKKNAGSKEPDFAYKPLSRLLESEWPSFVVEVAVSESLSELQGDMAYWLRNSGRRMRVAILLHINKAARTIEIERWAAAPQTLPSRPGV
jgi:hypothetical protein